MSIVSADINGGDGAWDTGMSNTVPDPQGPGSPGGNGEPPFMDPHVSHDADGPGRIRGGLSDMTKLQTTLLLGAGASLTTALGFLIGAPWLLPILGGVVPFALFLPRIRKERTISFPPELQRSSRTALASPLRSCTATNVVAPLRLRITNGTFADSV